MPARHPAISLYLPARSRCCRDHLLTALRRTSAATNNAFGEIFCFDSRASRSVFTLFSCAVAANYFPFLTRESKTILGGDLLSSRNSTCSLRSAVCRAAKSSGSVSSPRLKLAVSDAVSILTRGIQTASNKVVHRSEQPIRYGMTH